MIVIVIVVVVRVDAVGHRDRDRDRGDRDRAPLIKGPGAQTTSCDVWGYYFYNVFDFAKFLGKICTNRVSFLKKSFLCAHSDVTDQL